MILVWYLLKKRKVVKKELEDEHEDEDEDEDDDENDDEEIKDKKYVDKLEEKNPGVADVVKNLVKSGMKIADPTAELIKAGLIVGEKCLKAVWEIIKDSKPVINLNIDTKNKPQNAVLNEGDVNWLHYSSEETFNSGKLNYNVKDGLNWELLDLTLIVICDYKSSYIGSNKDIAPGYYIGGIDLNIVGLRVSPGSIVNVSCTLSSPVNKRSKKGSKFLAVPQCLLNITINLQQRALGFIPGKNFTKSFIIILNGETGGTFT